MKREIRWPTIEAITCDLWLREECRGLGRIIFQYDPSATWQSVCDEHGVYVEGRYGDRYGGFHSHGNVIVHGSGGSGLSDGDVITHDPESCLKGLEEARR